MAEGEAKLSEEASEMESRIKDAMFSRASYFRDQAEYSSFSLYSVSFDPVKL